MNHCKPVLSLGPSLLMSYIPPTPKPLVHKQLCNEKANALAILPLQSFVSCNASCEKMLGGICKTELFSGTCKSALSTIAGSSNLGLKIIYLPSISPFPPDYSFLSCDQNT